VHAATSTLDVLQALASSLVIRWHDLDDAGRLAHVKEIMRAAAGLPNGPQNGHDPHPDRSAPMTGLPFLTPRELEILHAIAEGDTTAAMSARFAITPLTVRSHVKNVLHKLGVHSRLDAARVVLSLRSSGGDGNGSVGLDRLGGSG
jgi:DNA-binding NarL/FixJ family response regulator